MENVHKIFSYIGMLCFPILGFSICRYFLVGDDGITNFTFCLGMILMIIPTTLYQVAIPAGFEDLPIMGIISMYAFVFPFADALIVICIKGMIGEIGRHSGFPFIGVAIIYFLTMFVGFGIKMAKEKITKES